LVEVSVAVVWPLASLRGGVETVLPVPLTDKVTVWPGTGLKLGSIKVIVMVEDAVPSATKLPLGFTDTEELIGLTGAGTKATRACCVMLVAPTLALIVLVSASVEVI
jgi:hypothetical protein